jgi:hypothetical protein
MIQEADDKRAWVVADIQERGMVRELEECTRFLRRLRTLIDEKGWDTQLPDNMLGKLNLNDRPLFNLPMRRFGIQLMHLKDELPQEGRWQAYSQVLRLEEEWLDALYDVDREGWDRTTHSASVAELTMTGPYEVVTVGRENTTWAGTIRRLLLLGLRTAATYQEAGRRIARKSQTAFRGKSGCLDE